MAIADYLFRRLEIVQVGATARWQEKKAAVSAAAFNYYFDEESEDAIQISKGIVYAACVSSSRNLSSAPWSMGMDGRLSGIVSCSTGQIDNW